MPGLTLYQALVWLGAGAVALLAYAILTAYVLPLLRFFRDGHRENRRRREEYAAWREKRFGIQADRTPWWFPEAADDCWWLVSLPLGVLTIFLFFR
jgi:hypothetical protein